MKIIEIAVGDGTHHRLELRDSGKARCLDHTLKDITRSKKLIQFGDVQPCPCIATYLSLEEPKVSLTQSPDSNNDETLRELAGELQDFGIVKFEVAYDRSQSDMDLNSVNYLPDLCNEDAVQERIEKVAGSLLETLDSSLEEHFSDEPENATGYGHGTVTLYPFHGVLKNEYLTEIEIAHDASDHCKNEKLPKELAKKLLAAKITKVHAAYSGAGDSGQFDNICNHAGEELPTELSDELENFLSDLLDYDWYNNEGGQGSIDVDVKKREITIEASYNEHQYDEAKITAWAFVEEPWLSPTHQEKGAD